MSTRPRGKVEASLAERGRPAMWANEQEAAVLSGVNYETFRQKVHRWEAQGFPTVNGENRKRPIPGILAFWRLPQGAAILETAPATGVFTDEEEGLECWADPTSPTGYRDQHGKPVSRVP